jgi:hypothetical protein
MLYASVCYREQRSINGGVSSLALNDSHAVTSTSNRSTRNMMKRQKKKREGGKIKMLPPPTAEEKQKRLLIKHDCIRGEWEKRYLSIERGSSNLHIFRVNIKVDSHFSGRHIESLIKGESEEIINMANANIIHLSEQTFSKCFSIEVTTSTRNLYFFYENQLQEELWCNAINGAVLAAKTTETKTKFTNTRPISKQSNRPNTSDSNRPSSRPNTRDPSRQNSVASKQSQSRAENTKVKCARQV